jgi:hypothetical protein
MATKAETDTALLLDRAQISEVIYRYHRAFDRRDWETCRTFFTDKVEVETTGMERSVPQVQTFELDRYIRILQRMAPAGSASQHFSLNHIIEIDGDEAVCVASSMARSCKAQEPAANYVGGYYTFTLVRIPSGWRIRKFRFDQGWNENHPLEPGA